MSYSKDQKIIYQFFPAVDKKTNVQKEKRYKQRTFIEKEVTESEHGI